MTARDDLVRDLTDERWGPAVKQWHPNVESLLAAGDRVVRLEVQCAADEVEAS